MYDKEKLYTTRLYFQKLSYGQNPFDGSELPQDELLNNVDLSRAFQLGAEILEAVQNNNCEVGPIYTRRSRPFKITDAARDEIEVSEEPVGVAVVSSRITKVLDPGTKTVAGQHITTWLEQQGLLETVTDEEGKMRIATEDGNAAGITTEERRTRDGRTYKKNFYDLNAQRFIIENLEIIAKETQKKTGAG